MTARDDLKIFANTVDIDPIEGTPNRLSINDDLWNLGWLRTNPVAAQHLNQALYLITKVLKEDTLSPALNLSDVDDAVTARTNLGIDISTFLVRANNLSDLTNVPTARDNLGLNIDTLFNTFFDKIYPVGSIYTVSGVATNPATLLGRGTWVATAQGRVLVGVGTGTDSNGVNKVVTDGLSTGEYTHTQTQAELASHTHPYRDRYYIELAGSVSTASNKETTPVGYNLGLGSSGTDGGNDTWLYYDSTTTSTGSSTPFNVSQPSLGVYIWKRTA